MATWMCVRRNGSRQRLTERKEETRGKKKLAQLSLFNYPPGFTEMNEPQKDLCEESTLHSKKAETKIPKIQPFNPRVVLRDQERP